MAVSHIKYCMVRLMININIILNYINEHNLSKKEFAKLCNISRTTLYKLLNNDANITLCTIIRIAKATNISISSFVKQKNT